MNEMFGIAIITLNEDGIVNVSDTFENIIKCSNEKKFNPNIKDGLEVRKYTITGIPNQKAQEVIVDYVIERSDYYNTIQKSKDLLETLNGMI